MVIEDATRQVALKKLLSKLGIVSAYTSPMEEAIAIALGNHGIADQIFIDPVALGQYKKILGGK